ncbi:MAG: 6-phosphogluconolactonase [Pseudomonadota bacterium]
MKQSNYHWNEFSNRDDLARQLADDITAILNERVEKSGVARIAVSGGSTPKPLFEALGESNIDWSRVMITLVDERAVNEHHALSNAAFLKQHLFTKLSVTPKFLPLYIEDASFEDAQAHVLTQFRELAGSPPGQLPSFDVVVLGMGGDGHTASFFPDAANIADLVDATTNQALLTCESPSTQVPRITWSLPVLLNTGSLILHITGADKKKVFNTALSDDNALELPIRAAIFQQSIPLNVYFAE